MKEITFLIKTFERKGSLWRLLRSIEEHYPMNKIIVLDDSKSNYKKETLDKFPNLNLNYITTEFDVGLSKGRNILLDNTNTDYFVLCDDDFEFDERTDLETAKEILIKGDLDILAGTVHNIFSINSFYSIMWMLKKPSRILDVIRKTEIISVYNGSYSKNDYVTLDLDRNLKNYIEKDFYRVDIVNNFFIAKTKTIKDLGGWQPDFVKVGEHQLFFYRAWLENLKIGFTTRFGIKHYPKKTLDYNKYRFRSYDMFRAGLYELGIKKYRVLDEDKKVIMEFNRKVYEEKIGGITND